MTSFLTILYQVLSLFLMMAVGVFVRKKQWVTNEVKQGLIQLLIKIVSPAMIISSFMNEFESEKAKNALIVFILTLTIHSALALLSRFFFRKSARDQRPVLRYAVMFSNCAYMGYPVLQGIFGSEGVFFGAIYASCFHIFTWTFGVSIFGKREEKLGFFKTLRSVLSPATVALLIGAVIFLLQLKLPVFISTPIQTVGGMNTPVSMIILGANLADVDFRTILNNVRIYIVTAVKLVVIPLTILAIFLLINLSGLLSLHGIAYKIALIEASMPTAAYTAILAGKYGADDRLAAGIVAFSTLCSILTLPLLITLYQSCGI